MMDELYTDAELAEIHAFLESQPDPDFEDQLGAGSEETKDEETPRKNFTIRIQHEVLTLTVDLRRVEGESRTGRSWVISSSGGNVPLFDENGYRSELLNFSISKRKEGTKPQRWYPVR